MYGENRFRRYKSVQLRTQRFIRLIRHPRLNMSVFIVLFIASLALVRFFLLTLCLAKVLKSLYHSCGLVKRIQINQAHPHGGHGADTLHDGDHLDFLDLAARIATSTQHNGNYRNLLFMTLRLIKYLLPQISMTKQRI